jgi:type II secretory pathway component PulF
MKSLGLILATQVFQRRRAAIYEKMAFGLTRGGTPGNEFKAMYQNSVKRKSTLVPVYRHWYDTLRGSAAGRMALAMKDTVPEAEYSLLAIAEANQSLVKGLEFLAISVRKSAEMRKAFTDALRSSALPIFMLIAGIIAIDLYFFPMLEDSLPRREWPTLTKIVAATAHQMGTFLTYFAMMIPALLVFWYWSLPRLTGRPRVTLERLPLLYTKYRDLQAVMFLVNLAFLREAGASPRTSLIQIESMATPYVKSHVSAMIKKLDKEAINFGDVIVSTGLFNPDLAELISDYARWSDWHQQLRSIADTSMEIVTDDVKRLGPFMYQLLQLTMGFIIFILLASSSSAIVKVLSSSGL